MPKLLPLNGAPRGALFLALALFSSTLFAQLSVSVDGENPPCFGLSNGRATAQIANGTAPFSFIWSNGGTTQAITNLNAGFYSVTVTDDNGLTGTGSVTLTQPTQVTATISEADECTAPFVIAAEPAGGVAPYRYNWSTGADSRAVSVPAGDYCVTVVDFQGCGYVACTQVEANPPGVSVVGIDVQCNGDDDGQVTANPTAGVPPYSYRWSTGATTRSIFNVGPGAYRVTLTDSRGCTAIASTAISEPPLLTVAFDGDATVCPGASDAIIRLLPSGGTEPYSYLINPGGFTTQGAGSLPAGTYTGTVTDANECTATATFVVSEAPDVVVNISGDDLLCGAGATGTLTATPASGPVSQYTYRWSTGAVGPTITNVAPGTYTVTATDANGCTGTATATVRTINLDLTVSGTDASCADTNDGTATATASGGDQPYTYRWSNNATTRTITGLAPGVYRVTVTEANDCKVSGTVVIDAPDPLVIVATPTNVSCAGLNDGSIQVSVSGGTPAYTYSWSDGSSAEDRDDLGPGTYTVTVTDANGCTATRSATITAPASIVVTGTVTDVACNGDATGRVVLNVSGGTAPYGYAWSFGADTRIVSNLPAGDVSVTVTDSRGCGVVETFTIDEPDALVVTGTVTNVTCPGANDGAIDVTVSGGVAPYAFNWSGNAGAADDDEDRTNLGPGTYSVVVTDANNCVTTATFTVAAPDNITLIATPTDVSCFGGNDGSIAVSVSGGTAPYAYVWSDNATSANRDNLPAGTYTLTVTDANGCTRSATATVSQPSQLTVSAQINPVACTGENTGAINITVGGGTPGYTYLWSNGATTQDLTNLAAGTYTVTITDANGCTLVQSFTVTTVDQLVVTGVVRDLECFNNTSGRVTLSVSGGTAPYAYVWSNGDLTRDLIDVRAGTYSVTVTDANECTTTASFTITQPPAIMVTTTAPDIVCGGTATGTISAFASGGTGPYDYLWSNGDTGSTIENVAAGTYFVTVADVNGCTSVSSAIALNELPVLECEVVVDREPTTGNNGQLTADVDGGTQPYAYRWSNGATTRTISGLDAGTYSVTVTDANNCTTTCTGSLQALAGLGDFVWQDNNSNGQQDPGEPGIADYPVALKDANGNIIANTTTDANGFYSFMGLQPGTYSVLFVEPPGGNWSPANTGNDATDSDADPAMGGMTGQYVLDPGEFDMTVDAGFVPDAGGAIVDPCNCLNNNTTDLDGQFSEVIEVRAFPGQTWRIVAQDNMFLLTSGNPPVMPTPVPVGTTLTETTDPANPAMSIYKLEFLLVDSFRYNVTLTNGAQEISFTNQCFYPEVRFTDLPPAEICRFDAPVFLSGFGRLNGVELPGSTVFTINGTPISQLDPSTLPLGSYEIVAEFIADPALDENGLEFCRPQLRRQFLLIDDCLAKLGDLVFLDENLNGQQDPGEPGIPNVGVTVTSQDGTYTDNTTTDANGMYMFSVPPGTYKLTFERPEGLQATTPNSGTSDELDSDMMLGSLMTDFYTVGIDEMDFSIDAGFVNPCIANIVNPGTIGFSQEVCGPGNAPEPLVEIAPATGGQGNIQYLWMRETQNPNQDINFWEPIPNSDSPNYTPGPVSQTTWFARCVRRNNCQYLESNIVVVEVGDDAVAQISAPTSVCVGEDIIFQAVNPGAGAQISWSFTGSADVTSATGALVTNNWATFGSFSVTLTVTRNGCTSTQVRNVAVLNNPTRCGGNLTANGTVDNLQAREVTIEWEVPADGSEYAFELERSTDGMTFERIASLSVPTFVSGNDMAMFRQEDVSPLAGRTFYRVRMLDAEYGDLMSNVIEMQLALGTSTGLGRIFPNPATNGMLHVEMLEASAAFGDVIVQLFDARGNRVGSPAFPAPGSGVINLPVEGVSAGIYFLRMTVGEQTETHRVVIN